MNEKNGTHKKGSWGVRSVYIALGICLVAVAVASWITFESISSTLNSGNDSADADIIEPVNDSVSGVTEDVSSMEEVVSAEPEEAVDTTPESLTLPLQNGVIKSYSGEALVYSETLRDWRAHNGTDFAAEEGEEVLAAADGTVSKVYDDGLMGYVVIITSGSMEVSYCGLDSEIPVSEGDSITAGQVIGTVGMLPAEQADGPHLHLEVKLDGVYSDAEVLIKAAS